MTFAFIGWASFWIIVIIVLAIVGAVALIGKLGHKVSGDDDA